MRNLHFTQPLNVFWKVKKIKPQLKNSRIRPVEVAAILFLFVFIIYVPFPLLGLFFKPLRHMRIRFKNKTYLFWFFSHFISFHRKEFEIFQISGQGTFKGATFNISTPETLRW